MPFAIVTDVVAKVQGFINPGFGRETWIPIVSSRRMVVVDPILMRPEGGKQRATGGCTKRAGGEEALLNTVPSEAN